MMIGRSDDPENPARINGASTPRTCLGMDRGTHLGQRHAPRQQAGHMTAHRTRRQISCVTPCTPGPSTHDPRVHGAESRGGVAWATGSSPVVTDFGDRSRFVEALY